MADQRQCRPWATENMPVRGVKQSLGEGEGASQVVDEYLGVNYLCIGDVQC